MRLAAREPGSLSHAVIRSRKSDQTFVLKLLRKSSCALDDREMRLHAKAAASEHVVTLHQRGASSTKVYFAIEEHCEGHAAEAASADEGVRDDELFWRWSSQIARGVVDIHRAGIIHLAIEPRNIALTETDDVRIGKFHSACEVRRSRGEPFQHPDDKPEYRAPNRTPKSLSFASDVYSVGVTLYEMATGELPSRPLDRDELSNKHRGSRQRELIAFALRDEPSERPTAEDLLQKITILAPSSMMESEFRAQVFASMRFNDHGPMAEAKLLRGKLAAQGVHLHIIAPLPGESIDKAVFGTMAKCDAFLAMATKDYGADTGNTASTYHEVRTWKEESDDSAKGRLEGTFRRGPRWAPGIWTRRPNCTSTGNLVSANTFTSTARDPGAGR